MTPSETTNATTANLRRVRAALYLTTAAAAVAIPGIGQANTTSTVAAPLTTITVDATPVTPDTVATVNAATGAVTTTNVTLNVTGAIVTGGGSTVNLGYVAAGKGDGAIIVNNTGKIGVVTGGVVTDAVGVFIAGGVPYNPGAPLATNTVDFTNNGLITGGIAVATSGNNIGGDVNITNGASGVLYGGVDSYTSGNSTFTNAAGATFLNGNVTLRSGFNYTQAIAGGLTTRTFGTGNATIQADANIGTTLSRGNLRATAGTGGGTAAVTANGVAGTITTNTDWLTSNASKTVTGGNALVANAAGLVTTETDSYASKAASAVTIGASGDVTGINANAGTGGSTVKISGKVGTGGVSSNSTSVDSLSKTVVNTDAGALVTLSTTTASVVRNGGASAVTIDAGGSVNGNVTSKSDTNATVLVNGKVTNGGVTANAQTGVNSDSSVTTTATSSDTQLKSSLNANSADVTFGSGATLTGGDVNVLSNSKSTFTNGGKLFNTGGFGNVNVSANAGAIAPLIGIKTATTSPGNSTVNVTVNTITNAGGTAEFTNNNYIGGNVTVDGPTGVVIKNNLGAQTAGTTTGTSQQQTAASVTDVVTTSSTSGTVTTSTTTVNVSGTDTATGGSVDGLYAGTNGEVNFAPTSLGTITQTANKASTALVSGTVYGNVSSTAGTGTNNTTTISSVSTLIDDVAVLPSSGSDSNVTSSTSVSKSTAGGNSTVTVSGKVLNTLGGGNVSSTGTDSSTVGVSGTVNGNVGSTATGAFITTVKGDSAYSRTNTKGVFVTTAASDSASTVTKLSGGAAVANVTGTGVVGGNVTVKGVSSASSTVDAGAKISGNLSVTANGTDVNNTSSNVYAYDPSTKVATIVSKSATSSGTSAAVGDATATVAGTVTGSVLADSYRGNATATITGKVGGDVTATAWKGTVNETTSDSTFQSLPAFAGDNRTSVGALPVQTKLVTTTKATKTASGKALVTIDTAASLQAAGIGNQANGSSFNSVVGNVLADGTLGGTVVVTKGSSVGGNVTVNSFDNSSANTTTTTFGAKNSTVSVTTDTNVGKIATLTNDGTIGTVSGGNIVTLTGTTGATLTNTGRINAATTVRAVRVNGTTTVTDNDSGNTDPSTRQIVTTQVNTAVFGLATVTNSGVINGALNVQGGAASNNVTNTGVIVGTTTLGVASPEWTAVTTQTSTGTTGPVYTANATLSTQTYKFDQNGTSGGVNVTGAIDPTSKLKTSNIVATVNLNSGSVTLGNITADQTAAFAPLTTTTVNLNGSGFLGLDFYSSPTAPTPPSVPARIPEANISAATAALFGLPASSGLASSAPANIGTRILGVGQVNKTGAGTFVIVGTPFNTSAAVGVNPWTWDIGAFNNTAGETQLTLSGTGSFGVRGDINNAAVAGQTATLVVGRRVPTAVTIVGDSLVSAGPEVIRGITINETGNFTQGTGGTLAVGITPSLVRVSSATTSSGGSGATILAPVGATVNIPFFTIPANASGLQSTPSRINVTGNVNLAGKVAVDVSRDSIYSDGDGYVLFTYTGTGVSTATVASNLTSQFVNFSLKNDTTAKTISLVTTRNGYNTFSGIANDENARNAAAGLNSALSAAVANVKADALGTAIFPSAIELGNAQDVLNIASAADFRLSNTQLTQLFVELSSAEIYSSLAALDQNAVFGQSLDILTERRSAGASQAAALLGTEGGIGARLWINPVAQFARYGTNPIGAQGQSAIKANTYGCLLYTSPSPRDGLLSRMPSSA